MSDVKIADVANNVVNKNRKYKHNVEKSIKTKRKEKTVKRETVYKSDVPSSALGNNDLCND